MTQVWNYRAMELIILKKDLYNQGLNHLENSHLPVSSMNFEIPSFLENSHLSDLIC